MFSSRLAFLRYRPFSRPVKVRKLVDLESTNTPVLSPIDTSSAPVLSSPFQAVKLLKAFHISPNPDRINLNLTLNVDLKRHSVRGIIALPHGIQSDVKLLVFCPDHEAEDMRSVGADFAGLTDIITRINKGWLEFDKCIATPAMMPHVLKISKILGPKKLMPNPKSGTIVENLILAIQDVKAGGSVEFRAEQDGRVVVPIGLTSFADSQILDNCKCIVRELLKQKPKDAKKTEKDFFDSACFSTDQGPLVGVDPMKMQLGSTGYFR